MPTGLDIVVQAATKLMSPAAPQVLTLVGSSSRDLEQLRAAVELDPVLTLRFIDFANHSYYARRVPVASLQRALVRVGWDASCDLLSRLVVESAFERGGGDLSRPIWEHSLRTAVLARLIAREARIVDPALAFTAGLIHGIGMLGLLALHRDAYAELWRSAPSGPHLAQAERRLYDFDHAKVGAGVLDTMSVPSELPEAIRRIYRSNLAKRHWDGRTDLALAAVLQLSLQLLYGEGERLADPDWILHQRISRRLHLGPEHVDGLAERFEHAVHKALGTEDEAEHDDARDSAA